MGGEYVPSWQRAAAAAAAPTAAATTTTSKFGVTNTTTNTNSTTTTPVLGGYPPHPMNRGPVAAGAPPVGIGPFSTAAASHSTSHSLAPPSSSSNSAAAGPVGTKPPPGGGIPYPHPTTTASTMMMMAHPSPHLSAPSSHHYHQNPNNNHNNIMTTPFASAERSPNIARMPIRLQSPAMVPVSSFTGAAAMNPHAAEFAPKQVPPLLPSSTAAAAAGAGAAAPSSSSTASATIKPPMSYAAVAAGGDAQNSGLSASSAAAAKSRSTNMREMLQAAVYMPRRTLNRVTLTRNVGGADGSAGAAGAGGDGSGSGRMDKFRDVWKFHYLPRGDRWASKSDAYDPMVVATIDNIPTFWQVFNNLPTPHQKKLGTYYCFRDDIDPKWEHEANRGGGMLRVPVGENRVDAAWELLLLRAVGASWCSADVRRLVNGVVVKMREKNAYTLELWVTQDSEDLRRDLEELWSDELGGWFELTYISFDTAASAASGPSSSSHHHHGSSKNQSRSSNNNNNNNNNSGHHSHFKSSHDGKKSKVNPFSR